jgi:hypothetical protein
MEGMNSSMISLIYCKNFCKHHNVPPYPNNKGKKISQLTHLWVIPIILATQETRLGKPQSEASLGNSSQCFVSKIPNTNKGLVVEHLPSKPKGILSKPIPSKKKFFTQSVVSVKAA